MATKGRHMTCLSIHDWDSTLHSYKRDDKEKHDRQSFNKEYTDMYNVIDMVKESMTYAVSERST